MDDRRVSAPSRSAGFWFHVEPHVLDVDGGRFQISAEEEKLVQLIRKPGKVRFDGSDQTAEGRVHGFGEMC